MGIGTSHCGAFLAITTAFCCGTFAGISMAAPIGNGSCMECHGDKTLTTTNAASKEVSLFVDLGKLAASVHKTNTCASCHTDITSKHPDDNIRAKPANCTGCHV